MTMAYNGNAFAISSIGGFANELSCEKADEMWAKQNNGMADDLRYVCVGTK